MSTNTFSFLAGAPYPLGATLESDGVNFALYSEHATAVTLCLFDEGGVWHIKVVGLASGAIYGYRVDGPYDPVEGYRFNAKKVLLDPYAKALSPGCTGDGFEWGVTKTAPRLLLKVL